MSFILDALRKAEHGRQSVAATPMPIIPAEVPAAPPNIRRHLWTALAIATMAAIAVAALAFFRANPDSGAPTPIARTSPITIAPEPTPARPVPQVAQADAIAAAGNKEPVRPLDREIGRADPTRRNHPADPATQSSTGPAPIQPGTVTIMQPEPASAQDAVRFTVPAAAPPDLDSNDYAGLPEYENLLRAGRINLPNMRLDMHVYNHNPAKRFVFVNLKKYRRGDLVDGKARIEAITQKGVVLNSNGVRFVLLPD